MKSFNIIFLFLFTILLFSCGSKESKNQRVITGGRPDMVVTANDSVAVENLITSFFEEIKNKRLDEAIYSLYDPTEKDETGAPVPLSEEKCQNLIQNFQNLNIVDYSIINIIFEDAQVNQVTTRVVLNDGVSFRWVFKPMRAFNKWHLSIMD